MGRRNRSSRSNSQVLSVLSSQPCCKHISPDRNMTPIGNGWAGASTDYYRVPSSVNEHSLLGFADRFRLFDKFWRCSRITHVVLGIRSRISEWIGILLLVSAHCATAASNPIVVENALPGNPASDWDITGAGDSPSRGSRRILVSTRARTIRFKIKTNATNYRLDIYRLGYYGGLGARLVATVTPSAALPQTQPNPITDLCYRASRLRELGRVRFLGRARNSDVRSLYR